MHTPFPATNPSPPSPETLLPIVLIHLGPDPIPTTLYECILQIAVIHHTLPWTVIVILDSCNETEFWESIDNLRLQVRSHIQCIHAESLPPYPHEPLFPSNAFPNAFFLRAFQRLPILARYMESHHIPQILHLEYDVLLYGTVRQLQDDLYRARWSDRMVVVRDAPHRALASILYVGRREALTQFLQYASTQLQEGRLTNEMNLLGSYIDRTMCVSFPNTWTDLRMPLMGYFDGAALGQFLGGISPRNLPPRQRPTRPYDNPTEGFQNETSTIRFTRDQITEHDHVQRFSICAATNTRPCTVQALHVHSKRMMLFGSWCRIRHPDIITGDRIWSACHWLFLTHSDLQNHPRARTYCKRAVMVSPATQWDAVGNAIVAEWTQRYTANVPRIRQIIRIAIYGTLFSRLMPQLLPHLPDLPIEFYIHNSNESIHDLAWLDAYPQIHRIYAQNLATPIPDPRIQLLPIGIANVQWPHGDLDTLFSAMYTSSWQRKSHALYIQMNPKTHPIRQTVYTQLNLGPYESIPYKDYLAQLASHRFVAICPGNGPDTHRLWESLYMGCIPVLLRVPNDPNVSAFYAHLARLPLPLVWVDTIDAWNPTHPSFDTHYSQTRYEHVWLQWIHQGGMNCLKLSTYC